jgi:hypothetical protein
MQLKIIFLDRKITKQNQIVFNHKRRNADMPTVSQTGGPGSEGDSKWDYLDSRVLPIDIS